MTDLVFNDKLAYKVFDEIVHNPDNWNQGCWVGGTECGTTYCFAGFTLLFSGYKPEFDSDGDATGDFKHPKTGSTVNIQETAAELLGIDNQASYFNSIGGPGLFAAGNNLELIERMICDLDEGTYYETNYDKDAI